MKLLLKNIPLLLLRRVRMRKIIAIAFILFMFASTTTALAGDKRFCGYINHGTGENDSLHRVIFASTVFFCCVVVVVVVVSSRSYG